MYNEFKIRFFKLEELNQAHLPTAVSAPKPTKTQGNTGASAPKPARIQVLTAKPKQRRNKRATVSPTSARRGKKSRSEQSLPPPTTALSESENSLMEEESDFSDDSSEKHVILKDVTSAAVSGVSDVAAKSDDPQNSDEVFLLVHLISPYHI
ncbi:hypothetical protein TNCT_143131 [Trichonephila clavata]|uniref:Uncharacterized protein n=1 Tax=Trichonephila clavata TaxID=2740835 RepID=A0A8X6M3R7_TRICU|nr:hypothetical protein TNCT_143061 [Trichonephila clavata]GFR30942.1 hypothetical protein TNCT_143131 [Trichonephila clavata]